MLTRFTVTLTKEEREALNKLAIRDYRDIRSQAAMIIRMELERNGLLPTQKLGEDMQHMNPKMP